MAGESEPVRLRRSAQHLGYAITHQQSRDLYRKVHDHDLCIDALNMPRRPQWLEAMVGPHPYAHALGELLDRRDIAGDEWGPLG